MTYGAKLIHSINRSFRFERNKNNKKSMNQINHSSPFIQESISENEFYISSFRELIKVFRFQGKTLLFIVQFLLIFFATEIGPRTGEIAWPCC